MAKDFAFGVKILMDSQQFTQGINAAKQSTMNFGGAVSKVAGGLGKILGPLGLGVGGFALLKKGIESTDGSADKLEETVGLLKGGFQGLFSTIFSGDWSNLFTNITNTAQATRDLATATDQLGMSTASNSIKLGRYERELQAARLAAAETTDPTKRAEAIKQAIDAQKAITAVEVENVRDKLKITEDFFTTKMGWSDEERKFNINAIKEIAGNYKYYYGENSVAVEGLQERLKSLNYLENSRKEGLTDSEKVEQRRISLLLGSIKIFEDLNDQLDPGKMEEYITTLGSFEDVLAIGDLDLVKLQKQLTTTTEKVEKLAKAVKALTSPINAVGQKIFDPNAVGGEGHKFENITMPTFSDVGNMTLPNKLVKMDTDAAQAIIGKNNAMQEAIKWNEDLAESEGRSILILEGVADAFNGLGTAIGGATGEWISYAGNLISTIPTLIGSIIALSAAHKAKAAAESTDAAAGAASAVASIPIIGPILAIAAIASTVAALLAIPKFAAGGTAMGGWSMVGEKGAELVNLPRGAEVFSNQKSMNMLGGNFGGGQLQVTGQFVARGTDLIAVIQNTNREIKGYK